ncbi:MAG: GyrI-like domain-containing protein [Pseudomonadota bacterium]
MADVRIEEFVDRDVVFVRRYGPYETSAMEAWQTLWAWVNEKGHTPQVKRVIGASWDHPEHTTPSEIRYDACIEMHARVDGDPGFDIGLKTLPGGPYAVTLFEGPYQGMGPALRDLADVQVPARSDKSPQPDG